MNRRDLSRRSFLTMSAALPLTMKSFAAPTTLASVYIGTDTDAGDGTAKGIYQSLWDPAAGTLTSASLAAETLRPIFLAKAGNHIYVTNEINGPHDTVTVFTPASNNKLHMLNSVAAAGVGPTYISIHPSGRAAYVASYGNGCVTSFHILRDGKLSEPVSKFQDPGHGPKLPRQAGPHAHSAVVSPDGNFLLVNDLGADAIYIFRIDADHPATLTLHGIWSATPGSGPRHIAFAPGSTAHTVYSVNELNSTIDTLAWNAKSGSLTTAAPSVSTLPAGFIGTNAPAEILISPDGRFLYVSNRGEDTVAAFTITPQGPSFLQHIASGGKNPRYMALSPDGHWLLAANLDSSNITVFRRDEKTGEIAPTGNSITVPHPVSILFA
jgi:6-phosphogluconolactonase